MKSHALINGRETKIDFQIRTFAIRTAKRFLQRKHKSMIRAESMTKKQKE